MRLAFGLVGILVTTFVVIIMIWALLPDTRVIKPAMDETRQWAGQDSEGRRAGESLKFLAMQSDSGKLKSVLVQELAGDDPMSTFWGLRRNDAIVEIEQSGLDFADMGERDVKDFLLRAYQYKQKIHVMRDGQRITLPQAPPPRDDRPALQRQLDAIRDAGSR